MSDLTAKTCKPCEGGVAPLAPEQVNTMLPELNDWQINADYTEISKAFEFKNFFRTMSFVNAVAHLANNENHHPDMSVSYNKCEIRFSTHAIGGLSENDFICAAKVDKL